MIMMKCHRFSEHKTLTIELLQFLLFNVHWDFRFWLLLGVTFFIMPLFLEILGLYMRFYDQNSYVFSMFFSFLFCLAFECFYLRFFYLKRFCFMPKTQQILVMLPFISFLFDFLFRNSSIPHLRAVYFMSICLHCRTLSSIDQIIMMQNLLYALWQCQDMDGHLCKYRRQRFLCAVFFPSFSQNKINISLFRFVKFRFSSAAAFFEFWILNDNWNLATIFHATICSRWCSYFIEDDASQHFRFKHDQIMLAFEKLSWILIHFSKEKRKASEATFEFYEKEKNLFFIHKNGTNLKWFSFH